MWSNLVTRSTYLGLRIALPIETSNAENPTYDVIYIVFPTGYNDGLHPRVESHINTLRGIPVALF